MLIALSTHVSFTAALVRRPVIRSEKRVEIVLGGVRSDVKGVRVFYHPALALGTLAGRMARLEAGEGITGHATLGQTTDGDTWLIISEVVRLPHLATRLQRDERNGLLLKDARLDIEARGMLMSQPVTQRLEDQVRQVTNVTLGLTPQRNESDVSGGSRLMPLELAAYGDKAVHLQELQGRRYVMVRGQLQRRLLSERRITRVEVEGFEALHPQRAMV